MQSDFERFAGQINAEIEKDNCPTLATISARELQAKKLPPLKFVVEGLLAQGLSLICSPPKYGKSWLMLDLCLAVSQGERFLGLRTHKTGTAYLALEDGERRLQNRMERLLSGRQAPENFFYATEAQTLENGLLTQLEGFLETHPQTGLIVLDTLQKVRDAPHGREGAYSADYREIGALKRFADRHEIALCVVHHLRKLSDDSDPFSRISGTNGLSGAADAMFVLTRERRSDARTTLSVTGRDVEAKELVLQFDAASCRWQNLGDAEAFEAQEAQREFLNSPIRQTVLKLLEQRPEGWSGTAQDIIDAGRFLAQTVLAPSPRDLAAKLTRLDTPLFEIDGIVHDRAKNGSGGGKHRFYKNNVEHPIVGLVDNVDYTNDGNGSTVYNRR